MALKVTDYGKHDFIGLSKIFVPASILAVALSIVMIAVKGFNYGVDFAGGTEVQVQFNQPMQSSKIKDFAKDLGFPNASVQAFETGNEYLIRLEPSKGVSEKDSNRLLNETIKKITGGLELSFKEQGANILRVDTVGPQVGSELKRNGILAAFYSLLLILVYIGLRFDYKFAPGAVFCLFHDTIVILGIYALFRIEMNIQTMAAVLTIIGYSLNDTIVVFDRIRENEKIFREMSFRNMCNRSINDVLARSILTSLTTFMAVAVMYLLAGGVIRDFALTMAIGIIVGTYSTIYVATPLVIVIDSLEHKQKRA